MHANVQIQGTSCGNTLAESCLGLVDLASNAACGNKSLLLAMRGKARGAGAGACSLGTILIVCFQVLCTLFLAVFLQRGSPAEAEALKRVPSHLTVPQHQADELAALRGSVQQVVGDMQQLKEHAEKAPVDKVPVAHIPAAPLVPPTQPKHAILALAKGIELPWAHRFIASLRRHMPANSGVDVHLWVHKDDVKGQLAALFELHRVQLHEFSEADLPSAAAGYHPSTYRWMQMRDWMKEVGAGGAQPYEGVMFTDSRDTVFQGNPFTAMQAALGGSAGRGFFAFQEAKPTTIGQCGWNSGWVKDCFGPDGLAAVASNVISCSGTSMGTWEQALAYATLMGDTAESNPRSCERNGVDQGFHNYFVHAEGGKAIPDLHLVSNEEGWIATVQGMRSVTRDEWGRVLNQRGEPVAVVHQYDRSPHLTKQFTGEYPLIPQEQRGLK